MGSLPATVSVIDEEKELIANLEQIVTSLESNKSLAYRTRKIIANLGSRLINIALSSGGSDESEVEKIEHQLSMIHARIMSFNSVESSMIWDSGHEEAYAYLKAVEEADKLTRMLESRSRTRKEDTLLDRADVLRDRGMAELEQEFGKLLHLHPFVEEQLVVQSSDEDNIEDRSFVSTGDDALEIVEQRDSIRQESVECRLELVPREVILFLKRIANLMFGSNYGHECIRVYVNARKDALDECLLVLKMEKLSIEDVAKMNPNLLNSRIRKWLRAIKPFVEVHLVSEKSLYDQIFGDIESVGISGFVQCSRASVTAFLNFCEAISISPRRPEKLMSILDMYEALSDLIPKLATLYSDDDATTRECEAALRRLGDWAKATFIEFQMTISLHTSATDSDGRVHILTRYVMNYLRVLAEWRQTFDELMKENHVDEGASDMTPTEKHFGNVVMILEDNLDEKSKQYKDEALRQIFLLNNIQYMIEKVKGSHLRIVLGDHWIKKHNGKLQHHAINYRQAAWSLILTFVRERGIDSFVSDKVIKEKLHSFNLAFEEVYRTQTGWSVPNSGLKDELRLSISSIVTPVYRKFVESYCRHERENYIKYTPEALDDKLWELFGGSQVSLHGSLNK